MTAQLLPSATAANVVAVVAGQPLTELPQDLYIPPEALEVFLEAFHGPLDLLLYLIRKQNIDLLDIPIAEITRQYMAYVELMKTLQLELAAEYLVMAALLAEMKSRLLLPRPAAATAEEADPRVELVRRLQEYEQIRLAAEALEQLPQRGREIFWAMVPVSDSELPKPQPPVALQDLLHAMLEVMQRAALYSKHTVQQDNLSVRERMSQILQRLIPAQAIDFQQLFSLHEGKLGVVVTFIALLELLKQALIEVRQEEPYSPIYIHARLVETVNEE